MLFQHAHLISPGLEIPNGFLLVDDGLITALGEMADAPASSDTTDLAGQLLAPGFIDIHSHGADGADVCDASPESLQHIAEKKLQEGVTTWLPTTLTQPAERLVQIVGTIRDWAPSAPLSIPGIHLEGPFINREQAGAQNPAFTRYPDPLELRQLHAIFPALILSLAPELPGALELIREARALGITPSAAHTKATYETLCDAIGFGLSHLTHYGNAMTPLHHREPGIIGGGLLEDSLMLELIVDRIHLCDDMIRLILKTVPLERLMLITDSVAASWRKDGTFQLGGLDVIIKDSAARLADGSLAGSTLKFNEGLRNLSAISDLPLAQLIGTTAANQARSLGLRDRGTLTLGNRADLVVLNQNFEVQQTYLSGQSRL
ncbi:MAG: N-acetylglucosamine-6-phosphate deacetylase [Verrucomicrobiaceae bacterium]